MAHNISRSNGINEAAYALRPAWHGLGQVLDNVPDSATMITAAHLDWRVDQLPVHVPTIDSNTGLRGFKTVEGYRANTRNDTGEVLGIVGDRYHVIQNHESFEFLDSLLQDGIMRYESAGALFGGRVVWVLARMPSVDEIVPGDNCHRYLLFQTSHDGSLKLTCTPTNVRVVCWNTLSVARGSQIAMKFRHTTNVGKRLDTVRQWVSQYDSQFTLFRDHARTLAATPITSFDDVKRYVTTLFPEPDNGKPGRARTIWDQKLTAIIENLERGTQRTGMVGGRHNLWTVLNAVTEYVDHQSTFRSSDGDRGRAENRFLGTTTGEQATFKRKAFELACEFANVPVQSAT